jgi:hypothetical protein
LRVDGLTIDDADLSRLLPVGYDRIAMGATPRVMYPIGSGGTAATAATQATVMATALFVRLVEPPRSRVAFGHLAISSVV